MPETTFKIDGEFTVDVTDIIERKSDSAGRINLGRELADKEVVVAVLEVVEE